jgi:hypothetical protein
VAEEQLAAPSASAFVVAGSSLVGDGRSAAAGGACLVREADVVQVDDLVAQPGGTEPQVGYALARRRLRSALDDGGGGLDAGLGLAGPRRRPSPEPGELLAGQDPSGRLGGRRLLLAGRPVLQVDVVAALVDVALPAVELEDASGDAIEQVAVVADQHQAAAVRRQALLEPGDGVDVEVVGRLIEHEQVALGHEGLGQRDSLGLPARQLARVGLHQWRHPEVVEHGGGLPRLSGMALDRRQHSAGGQGGPLGQGGDADVAAVADRTGLGGGLPGHDRQQRRLAASVQPDDPETITRGQRERDVAEQRPTGPAHLHTVDVDEDHGV